MMRYGENRDTSEVRVVVHKFKWATAARLNGCTLCVSCKEARCESIKPVNGMIVDQERWTGTGDEMSRVGVLGIVTVIWYVVIVVYRSWTRFL
jgi:hypothetical protein